MAAATARVGKNNPANCDGDVLPTIDDDAILDIGGEATIRLTTATEVRSVANFETLVIAGGSLRVTDLLVTHPVFELANGSVLGAVSNLGDLTVQGASNIAGTFTNAGTLRIQATNGTGNAVLTAANGLTNEGRIELAHPGTSANWQVRLDVTSDVLLVPDRQGKRSPHLLFEIPDAVLR
jgi:hypothetical protein